MYTKDQHACETAPEPWKEPSEGMTGTSALGSKGLRGISSSSSSLGALLGLPPSVRCTPGRQSCGNVQMLANMKAMLVQYQDLDGSVPQGKRTSQMASCMSAEQVCIGLLSPLSHRT